jgi:hypothetical protein
MEKTSEQESTLHVENVWERNGVPGENIWERNGVPGENI